MFTLRLKTVANYIENLVRSNEKKRDEFPVKVHRPNLIDQRINKRLCRADRDNRWLFEANLKVITSYSAFTRERVEVGKVDSVSWLFSIFRRYALPVR